MSFKSKYSGQEIEDAIEAVYNVCIDYDGFSNLEVLYNIGGSNLLTKLAKYPDMQQQAERAMPFYVAGLPYCLTSKAFEAVDGCCRTPLKNEQKPQLSQAEAFLCP